MNKEGGALIRAALIFAGLFNSNCSTPLFNSSVCMTEKVCKMYTPMTHLEKVGLYFLLLMVVLAFIADSWQKWRDRRERRLSANLDIFPTSYRALLKDCGAYMTDDLVQRYLQAIVKGYEASRTLLRTGQVDRASKRFDYVLWCFKKARESAQEARCNAETRGLLLDEGDTRYDEVERSNALLEKRRRARQ